MVSNMIDCQDGILALCMHSGKVHNILIKCAAPPLPPPPTKIKTKQNINTNQQNSVRTASFVLFCLIVIFARTFQHFTFVCFSEALWNPEID